jgi:ABC-type antimicrobial peptide transport system permease subunit
MLYEAVEPMLVATRVYVRSDLPTADVARRVRQVLWDVNPRMLPIGPGSLRDEVERNFPKERSLTWLVGIVALVATLLGCAGVHAVTAHGVSQRTREFGVRIALGASPADVIRQAARGLAWPTVAGAGIGAVLYAFGSRLIASRLIGVSTLDPATILGGVLLLASAVAVAAWLPARRATTVDPVVVLRGD